MINVDDMMGGIQKQTVFVASDDGVRAVTLLNHAIRYRIATNGPAEVTSEISEQWLYVLDADPEAGHRLRVFNAAGVEHAQQSLDSVAATRHALTTRKDGRVFVLKADATHSWVDAYQAFELRLQGTVADGPPCADHLLASVRRVALVCRASGEILFDDLSGHHATLSGPPQIVAATMADDGALYLLTLKQEFARIAPGTNQLETPGRPQDWSGAVVPDALAVAPGSGYAVLAQRTDDGAWLRMFNPWSLGQRQTFKLAGAPNGGLLTSWPFAYYTVGATVRHVDLTSGLLETMAEVGPGALPGVVVNS